jgi:DivIVA domain-containing protein
MGAQLMLGLVAVGIVVALALVLAGRLPVVPQPFRERYVARLPVPVDVDDIDALRFPVVLRGYRMDDVDAVLAVLRSRIAELESAADPVGDDDA